MRVLIVSPRYYPYIGGVEYVTKSIAERLAKMGHEVIVLAGEPSADHPIEEELNGVRIIRWPTWAPSNAYHIPRKRSTLDKLLREILREVDVVHVHSAHAVLPIYTALKTKELAPSTKLVITMHYHAHGHTPLRNLLWKLSWRRTVSKALMHADKIHAVSTYEAELIQRDYPHTTHKITIIPNGVEEDTLNYRWQGQNSDYIIYAGRIEKYKRLELAIDIAKKLNLKLIIVGNGPHRKKLMKYSNKNYPQKVHFLNPQPRHKYLELIANAKYAINPSTHEAYSIFIAEALTIGTPCIVSKVIARTLGLNTSTLVLAANQDPLMLSVCSNSIPSWNIILESLISTLYGGNR